MTRQVHVGPVAIGGGAPVSIQSMCNTPTENADATVAQILRLEQEGCDIVRVAVPTREAAMAIPAIKSRIHIPLVADIHFDYKLALLCIDGGVDKIRINPGNIGSPDRPLARKANPPPTPRRHRRSAGGKRAGPCPAVGGLRLPRCVYLRQVLPRPGEHGGLPPAP